MPKGLATSTISPRLERDEIDCVTRAFGLASIFFLIDDMFLILLGTVKFNSTPVSYLSERSTFSISLGTNLESPEPFDGLSPRSTKRLFTPTKVASDTN